MKKARRIIVYIAVSADGYIARPDGGIDWLDHPRPKGNYGMGEFFKSIDTILWGRKTYTEALERGYSSGSFGAKVKNYIFSTTMKGPEAPNVEFVNEPIGPFAQRLRAQPGKDIFMMGGGGIIASFLDVGEIDEFSIHVIPILIGEGIPLVQARHRNVRLKLISTKTFADGVVHLNYSVQKTANPAVISRNPARRGRN